MEISGHEMLYDERTLYVMFVFFCIWQIEAQGGVQNKKTDRCVCFHGFLECSVGSTFSKELSSSIKTYFLSFIHCSLMGECVEAE